MLQLVNKSDDYNNFQINLNILFFKIELLLYNNIVSLNVTVHIQDLFTRNSKKFVFYVVRTKDYGWDPKVCKAFVLFMLKVG